jgi:hypothetical protein
MKNILLALVILIVGVFSTSSFAKEAPKRKIVVISFTENDTKPRMPSSIDERAVVAAQARHVATSKSLDQAIENLD